MNEYPDSCLTKTHKDGIHLRQRHLRGDDILESLSLPHLRHCREDHIVIESINDRHYEHHIVIPENTPTPFPRRQESRKSNRAWRNSFKEWEGT